MWLEKTHLLVQGMSVSASCFAVWSGKSARVYRVDAQLSNVEPLEPFVCPARAMAIADTLHVKGTTTHNNVTTITIQTTHYINRYPSCQRYYYLTNYAQKLKVTIMPQGL